MEKEYVASPVMEYLVPLLEEHVAPPVVKYAAPPGVEEDWKGVNPRGHQKNLSLWTPGEVYQFAERV